MERCPGRYKLFLFCIFGILYAFLYILPNFWPPTIPSFLPLLRIDVMMPLLPWSFVIYISLYVLELLAVLLIQDMDHFRSFARMAFGALLFCGVFFVFFPTQYPRPPYPEVTSPVLTLIMDLVRRLDNPTNCFPSMHVAITGVATWNLRHKGPKVFLPFLFWALLICLSTLTTKQHYFLDVVAGLCVVATLALLDWAFFQRSIFGPIKAFPLSKR